MFAYAALATRNAEFYADRVFDPSAIAAMRPSLEPMATPWLRVHDLAQARGIRLVTADRVESDGIDPREVLLIAYDWTPDAERLIARGACPAVLVSFEPPVIAWWLYYHLERVSARFPHTFLFEGARERVAPTTWFHPLYFPQPCPPPRPTGRPWSKRRFLIMINSNKALPRARDAARWLDRPREVSLKRLLASVRYRPVARERYRARLRAIEAFSPRDDFDLYGEGWTQRHPAVEAGLHAAAQRVYRGSVSDKLALLAGYRFALVFENTRFPGYISEKLFDCFFARCIPIYSGAPDIAQYVPPAAFIDVRQFPSFPELERFLRHISEQDARRYIDAAHAFLISPAYESWCADHFARDLVDALVQVAESQPPARF
ncbi:MAG TPA: glycosyltransferase family 10, partial [Chloroflexota bacterium]